MFEIQFKMSKLVDMQHKHLIEYEKELGKFGKTIEFKIDKKLKTCSLQIDLGPKLLIHFSDKFPQSLENTFVAFEKDTRFSKYDF